MAVSIRSTTPTATSATINKPSGTVDGDCLLAIGYRSTGGGISTPSGWTREADIVAATATINTFWKVASSEPSSYTFTNAFVIGMTCFQGSDTVTPFNAVASTTGQGFSNLVVPSVTTTVDGCIVTRHLYGISTGSIWTESSGTEKFDAWGYAVVDTGVVSPAGASGTITVNQNQNATYVLISISIAPSQGLPKLQAVSAAAVMRASYW